MGRHGHVQVRHAEYGEVCFTGWVQSAAADWLEEKGINICTKEDCGVQYADSWEIEIPYKKVPNKKVPKKMSETGYAPDYGKIQRIIDILRKHPGSFDKRLSPTAGARSTARISRICSKRASSPRRNTGTRGSSSTGTEP